MASANSVSGYLVMRTTGIAKVGKLRPEGHVWPDELFNPACRAYTIICPIRKVVN